MTHTLDLTFLKKIIKLKNNDLRKYFRKLIIHKLEKKRIVLQKVTEKDKVLNLIRKIHPVKTKYDLIRLGPEGDGGYLLPNDIEGIESCFSPGVDQISDFEIDCLEKGMNIYLADKSVNKPNFNLPKDRYDFIKKFIGVTNNEDFITMDEWVDTKSNSENSDLLLQMDIEGAEYETILNISDKLMARFRIAIIEFHFLHDLWNPLFFKYAKLVFEKILQTHICVHIHPNNCCGIEKRFGIEIPRVAEFTFLRKDRISEFTYEDSFPHKLDFDNTSKKSIVLPKDWYRNQ